MKLATQADGSRDGHLVVLSDDLALAHPAQGRCTRLQQLLDDWNFVSPQLQDLATTVTQGKARHAMPHEVSLCLAPLPRAYRTVLVTPADTAATSAALLDVTERAGSNRVAKLPGSERSRVVWPALVLLTADLPAGSLAEQALDAVRLVGMALLVEDLPAGDEQGLPAPPRDGGTSPFVSNNPGGPEAGASHARAPVDSGALVFAPVVATPDHLGESGLRGAPNWAFALQRLSPSGKPSGPMRPWPARFPPLGAALARAARHALPSGALVVLPALAPDHPEAGNESDGGAPPAAWTLEPGRAARFVAVGPHGADLFGSVTAQASGAERLRDGAAGASSEPGPDDPSPAGSAASTATTPNPPTAP